MDPSQSLQPRFGEVLREFRHAAGLSQEALAERCGLHSTYISLLERGLNTPSLDAVQALATALGLRPHELVKASENG